VLGASFLTVYISEAHATNEWKLGNVVEVEQHKNLEDRVSAAERLIKETGWKVPVVVDGMENEFNKQYAAWPERAYVIQEGKMKYICDVSFEGDMEWVPAIENWLDNFYANKL